MKDGKKPKEYEAVWTCDFCGKEFKTKKESDKHELKCKKNPVNKNKKIEIFISILVIFFFVYLFTYFIVDSCAQSNGFKSKNLINPSQWFINEKKEEIIQENPKTELQNVKYNGKVISGTIVNKSDKPIFNTKVVLKISKDRKVWEINETHEFIVPYKIDPNQSINFSENYKTKKTNPWWTTLIQESYFYNNENVPTPSPTATPKPTAIMVNCLISAECGGGSRLLVKSVCDNSTCCQITGKGWIFYQNKQDCIKDQNIANNTVKTVTPTTTNQVNTTNYPLCTVYYPALKYSQSYSNIPPSQCQQWQNEANKTVSQNSYSTPTPYATPTLTESQAQAIIDQYNAQVTACRSQVNSNYNQKVQNCNIQFGGSSATEACTYAVNKERDSSLASCGQTY